jgi:hypothetical protein
MHHRVVRPITAHDTRSGIPARKRLGLVAGLSVLAVVAPLFTHGTEAGNTGWAWFAFFGLNALIAAFKPDVFL